jgi:DNA (cytosine-5)-methyltransferase 1
MKFRGVTYCSGIGAPEVAAPEIDWLYCAEIEKFPSAVLKHHRPHVPNLGDMMAPDFIARALEFGRPDIAVAGTPCQAFSVAGLRRSLEDARGNLTLRFVEIIDATRPRLVLWENVPGVLSTKDNAFGCFLGALVGADTALVPPRGYRWTDAGVVAGPKRTAAWRILDAQWFGLAQRRERVFVVADSGDGRAPEILFEREGLQRYFAPRREERQDVTGSLSARTSGGGGLGTDFECQGGARA